MKSYRVTKMIRIVIMCFCCAIMIISCKKDSNSSSTTVGSFTIKYELITSQNVLPPQSPYPVIQYTNGTGQLEIATDFTSGKIWSKTFSVTDTRRPFIILFNPNGIYLQAAGTITGNIYINGVKKATVTNPSINSYGSYFAYLNMSYNLL